MHSERLPHGDGAPGRRDAVIVYHAIGRVERSAARWNGFIRPERFAAPMSYLAEHRRVVDLDALLEPDASPGPPRVAITFDDGYRSVLEHGLPVLRECGFPATIFVPTRWIGARNTWDARSEVSHELMTGEELAELARSGFAVESHGHAHIDYARSDPRSVEADVRSSVERLAELLGRPPRYLAYPYSRGPRRPPARPPGSDCARHSGSTARSARSGISRCRESRSSRPTRGPCSRSRRPGATSPGAGARPSVPSTRRSGPWSATAGSGPRAS